MDRAGDLDDPGRLPLHRVRVSGNPTAPATILVCCRRSTGCWCARIPPRPAVTRHRRGLPCGGHDAHPTRQTPSESRQRSGSHTAAPSQLCDLRPHHNRLVQGRPGPIPMPPNTGRPGGQPPSLGLLAQSRVLAALEPRLRHQIETGPSWANCVPGSRDMIDAINPRIAHDPGPTASTPQQVSVEGDVEPHPPLIEQGRRK